MKFALWCYKNGSEGAHELKEKLGAVIIKKVGSKFKLKPGNKVINWGSADCPYDCINGDVNAARNKLQAFMKMVNKDISIPEFTTDKKIAAAWKSTLLARLTLTGNSGQGIVICEPGGNIPDAPLYVKYVKKESEFRIHVMNAKAIFLQQKKLKNGFAPNKIRSHDNGYVFATQDLNVPDCVVQEAIKATKALGLDFGALDVIYNKMQNKAYVLEANTAPGLCNQTAEVYAQAFMENYK